MLVEASCVLGWPADATVPKTFFIECSGCPTVTPAAVSVGPCIAGNRRVT